MASVPTFTIKNQTQPNVGRYNIPYMDGMGTWICLFDAWMVIIYHRTIRKDNTQKTNLSKFDIHV